MGPSLFFEIFTICRVSLLVKSRKIKVRAVMIFLSWKDGAKYPIFSKFIDEVVE